MAEGKVLYRISGHEKFALREGWISKGILAIENNPRIFCSQMRRRHLELEVIW